MADGLVVVIDDDPGVRRAVGRLLRSNRKNVQAYRSAKDFLGHELPSIPACLVVDLQMPEVNGLDLQQLLAANRSEERRVGKECRTVCRSRWSPYH